jgi:signal transduction histidine kinase
MDSQLEKVAPVTRETPLVDAQTEPMVQMADAALALATAADGARVDAVVCERARALTAAAAAEIDFDAEGGERTVVHADVDERIDGTPVRSLVAVPYSDGTRRGRMRVGSARRDGFPPADVRLVEHLALLANAAHRRLQLTASVRDTELRLEEERRRLTQALDVGKANDLLQTAHAAFRGDVSATLAQGRTMRDMLQQCCEAAVRHLGAAFARIWTHNRAESVLELQASAGLYTHIDGGHARVPVGKFKIGLIAAEKEAHLTNDVLHDERVGDRAWAAREGMVSFAGYPLLVDGEVVGVFAMFGRAPLAQETLAVLGSAADAISQGIRRKAAELALEDRARELQRSNNDLEQFAYVASHDLQEPLRMVSNYVQLIERRYKDKLDQSGLEFINFAVEGAQRMQRLINDLLSYSRVGRRGAAFANVDLAQIWPRVLTGLEASIADAHATVTADEPLPTVWADETQLEQLLQNLVSNAVKFHGTEPPKIHLSVERRGREWHFSMRDNGIGIEPQYFERIFIIFQRLHGRGEYPGTGIGLAVCKKIVDRHAGRIWVESTTGAGATFHFTLPAYDRSH